MMIHKKIPAARGLLLIMAVAACFAPLFVLLAAPPAKASDGVQAFRVTDLPLPRFVSLRSDKAYVRAGPALRYPIKWIYRRDGLPVEIVQEFENWRKIRDVDGDEGWIHQSLLSGVRTALIQHTETVPLYNNPTGEGRILARLEPQVVARIERCDPAWCRIGAGGYNGWAERKFLWGIYADEELN